jgi:glycosyltransferase involved in cell wall biosynthesis
VEVVPPGIACEPPPSEAEVASACARHGLEPGSFVLYAGNLDAYQELDTLREIARRLSDHPVVVATHERTPRPDLAPLRIACVAPDEVRTLTHGAAVAVAPRRRRGGFPIKLLNYMEAGRAIVARQGQAETLVDGCNAVLVSHEGDAAAFAAAIAGLLGEPARSARLGDAARQTARRQHAWGAVAARSLAILAEAEAS